jgi:hypothetical protein
VRALLVRVQRKEREAARTTPSSLDDGLLRPRRHRSICASRSVMRSRSRTPLTLSAPREHAACVHPSTCKTRTAGPLAWSWPRLSAGGSCNIGPLLLRSAALVPRARNMARWMAPALNTASRLRAAATASLPSAAAFTALVGEHAPRVPICPQRHGAPLRPGLQPGVGRKPLPDAGRRAEAPVPRAGLPRAAAAVDNVLFSLAARA